MQSKVAHNLSSDKFGMWMIKSNISEETFTVESLQPCLLLQVVSTITFPAKTHLTNSYSPNKNECFMAELCQTQADRIELATKFKLRN